MQKNGPARAEAFGGRVRLRPRQNDAATGLALGASSTQRLLLSQRQGPEAGAPEPDARARSSAGALRLPPHPRAAAPGRLVPGPESGLSALLPGGAAAAEQA